MKDGKQGDGCGKNGRYKRNKKRVKKISEKWLTKSKASVSIVDAADEKGGTKKTRTLITEQ